MGNKLDKTFWQGLAVQDDRVIHDNLRPKSGVANPSFYTQQNPRPGVPYSNQKTDLTLEASGSQSQDGHLQFLTARARHPKVENAGFVWRDVAAGDKTSQFKGWDGYASVTGWEAIRCSNIIVDSAELTIIRLQSGKMLIGGINPSLTASPRSVYRYDPVDASFTEFTFSLEGPIGSGSTAKGPGMLQLPTGRVLFYIGTEDGDQIDCYYSDDEGTTWALYSARVLGTVLEDHYGEIPTINQITVAYQGGQVVMVIEATDSEDTTTNNGAERLHQFYQYASDDLGMGFTFIGGLMDYSSAGHILAIRASRFPKVLPIPTGGFLLGFYEKFNVIGEPIESDFSQYVCRAIGNAWQPFADIPDTVIYTLDPQTGAQTDLQIGFTMWFDEDAALYAMVVDDLNSGSSSIPSRGWERISYLVCRSVDFGRSWEEWKAWTYESADDETYLEKFDCDCTAGRALLITRYSEGETPNDYAGPSVCCVYLGGFSDHTNPSILDTKNFKDLDYIGLADSNDGNWNSGRLYMPIGLPQNTGWTYSGVAGTITLGCDLNIANAIGQNPFYAESLDTTQNDALYVEFEMRLDTGGSLANDYVLVAMQLGDAATYEYRVHIRVGPTGIRIRDYNGAVNIGADILFDTSTRFKFRAILDKSGSDKFRCWWARSEDHHREWTEGPAGNVANAGAGWGPDRVEWGHWGGAIANDSNWFYFGYCGYPSYWSPRSKDEPADDWENYIDLHAKSYPTVGPYLIEDGVKIRASSGPSRLDETFDVEAAYDYPISNIDPRISPSPNRPWRSDSITRADIQLVYTMRTTAGSIFSDNDPTLVYMLNTNIKEFYVDGWNGAWAVLGHAIASDGYSGYAWDRREERVRPASATATHGEHWLYHEAHKGDTMLLKAGEDDAPVKITHNSEGAWYSDGVGGVATKIPTVAIDPDALAGLDTGGTTASIWRRDFGIIIAQSVSLAYDLIRIRIPDHITADGYFQIGNLYVGPCFVFGKSYDNEWTIEEQGNVDIIERRDGGRRSRVLGPRRRLVTFSLANTAIDLCPTQQPNPSPDFVSGLVPGSVNAIATPHDTSRMVMGVVDRAQGADLPVVLCRYVEQYDARYEIQLNVPLGQHYGRIVTDPSVDNVIGTELHNEVERMSRVTIEEEV